MARGQANADSRSKAKRNGSAMKSPAGPPPKKKKAALSSKVHVSFDRAGLADGGGGGAAGGKKKSKKKKARG